ncbi:aminoglycoside phosphotransferase family protein [Myceligenerans crystallogenes]|uniref:Streptomycin 6-kinase n=1 Tax=Myceligenerans crystallogenes TaxID=316335 RepID=A0ABN2NC62_9MICO
MLTLPASLQVFAGRGPEWAGWLDRLPRLLQDLLEEWELTPDGVVGHGRTAAVLPVVSDDGARCVLKAGWPHWEAEHEALALRMWHGNGAVRLLRADPHRFALLLERLHTRDLREEWDVRACEVVGGLYGRLHVAAPPQLRRLSDQAERWAGELSGLAKGSPLPRRLVEQAASIARDFAADDATDGRLLHTDLHFENVLAAHGLREGEDWLAIDPKPLSGDPHYELAPMLWNEYSLYEGRLREGVRQRFRTLVETAGLDEQRARDWVILRMLVNVKGELLENGAPDQDFVTACLAIAKAVQD